MRLIKLLGIGTHNTFAMAAFDQSLVARSANMLVKRENWAAQEPGVILVFCIIGAVAILLISLFAYKKISARRARKM